MQKKILIITCIILFISGCKKDESGSTNTKAANFTSSAWSYSSPYFYINLDVPEITSSNHDASIAMVYFSTGNGTWNALPYTQYNSPYNYYMGFSSSVGKVQVTWFYDTSTSKGEDPNTYYSTNIKFKVVVIPASSKNKSKNNEFKNYQEVKYKYDIIDLPDRII